KLDVVTGDKEIIPLKPIDGITQYPFVYGLDVRGDYLFAYLNGDGHQMYIIYDLANEEWLDQEHHGVSGLHVSPIHEGKIYFVQNQKLTEWDVATQTATPTGITQTTSFRNAAWAQLDRFPQRPVLTTVTYGGATVSIDVYERVGVSSFPGIQGSALSIHALETGPDGKLYMSGYTASNAAVYDPVTDAHANFGMGQAESIGISGSK